MRPEQERAIAYIRRKSTDGVERLRQAVATTQDELEDLIRGVTEEAARVRPAEGAWSVQEVVDHLVVTNRRAVAELGSLLSGWRPDGGPIPVGLQSETPLNQEWSEVRKALSEVHEEILDLLEGARDETPCEALAPIAMVVKATAEDGSVERLEWVEDWNWKAYAVCHRAHALEHIRQIQRTLAVVAAESADAVVSSRS